MFDSRTAPMALVLAFAFVFSSCGGGNLQNSPVWAPPSTEKPGRGGESVPQGLRVTATSGSAVANATVMIGMRRGSPFADNVFTTDAKGEFPVPPAWADTQPVTIEAKGYLRTTYMARAPGAHDLVVRPAPERQALEVSGQTKGFGKLSKDGWVDVGLVIPLVSRAEMIGFQVSALISPSTDTLDLPLGQSADIPSNLTLPNQRESYILPVTLDKPSYRFYLPSPGSHGLVALHGRFPVKTVVDELRAKRSVFEILNHFDFKGAGRRDVTTHLTPVANQDIAVDQIPFMTAIPVRAPRYDPSLVMISLALVEEGRSVFPTDVKKIEPGQSLHLKAPAHASLVLNVLRARDTSNGTGGPKVEEFTAALQAGNLSSLADFIPIARPPEWRAPTLVLDPPAAPASVAPAQTHAVFSRLTTRNSGKISLEVKTPEWDVFSDGWSQALDLPDPPSAPVTNGKYRWEVFFLGDEIKSGQRPRPPSLGPAVMETVTHVSKNAVDLP